MLDKAEAGSKRDHRQRKQRQAVPPGGAQSQELIPEFQLANSLAKCLGQARTDRTQLPVPKPSPVPLSGVCPDAARLGEYLSKCGRSATLLGANERTCKRGFASRALTVTHAKRLDLAINLGRGNPLLLGRPWGCLGWGATATAGAATFSSSPTFAIAPA